MVFYAIEKLDAEWVIYAHGIAIMRCAGSDVALQIMQMAHARLSEAPSSKLGRQRRFMVDAPVSPHGTSLAFFSDQTADK